MHQSWAYSQVTSSGGGDQGKRSPGRRPTKSSTQHLGNSAAQLPKNDPESSLNSLYGQPPCFEESPEYAMNPRKMGYHQSQFFQANSSQAQPRQLPNTSMQLSRSISPLIARYPPIIPHEHSDLTGDYSNQPA